MGPREPEIPRRAVIASRALAGRRIFAGHGKILLWVFATTLFFSALLLFSVQPMFGKLILPRLGGAPSVWAVSMCFFQAVLLAGYGYAFALNRWVRDGLALMIHLALMAVTGLMLPFGVPVAFAVPPSGDAYLWLLELLAFGIGLPFFRCLGKRAPASGVVLSHQPSSSGRPVLSLRGEQFWKPDRIACLSAPH